MPVCWLLLPWVVNLPVGFSGLLLMPFRGILWACLGRLWTSLSLTLHGDLWKSREDAASTQLANWFQSMRGRGQRIVSEKGLDTSSQRTTNPVFFFGYDMQHSRWLKQLRRLHSYVNWARVHFGSASLGALSHGLSL